MYKKIIGILVCTLLITAGSIAVADWIPDDGHKMHFPQMPDPNGFDVDFGYWEMGDDWKCSDTGTVDDIHFWISWFTDDPMDIPWIKCSIWTNEPNGPNGYSIPKDLKWERTFSPGQFVIAGPWDGQQRWYMPWGEEIPEYHYLYWQVNIPEIDDPFEQQEGDIYWLIIDMPFDVEFLVGWKNTKDYFMDHAVWRVPEGDWTMIDGIDFAFVITGEVGPEPECCLVIEDMWGGFFGSPSSLNVKAVIKNIGTAECKEIEWEFKFTGIVLLGPNGDTISSLLPGETANISSKIVIGLAVPGVFPGNVTAYANCYNNACAPATMEKQMFLFFILLSLS